MVLYHVRPYIRKENVLSVLLNKQFSSFSIEHGVVWPDGVFHHHHTKQRPVRHSVVHFRSRDNGGLERPRRSLQRALPHSRQVRERNVFFNDALNTFYLRLYGVRHMVKDHSDSEKENPLPSHRLLLSINRKGSFICTIPQTG